MMEETWIAEAEENNRKKATIEIKSKRSSQAKKKEQN